MSSILIHGGDQQKRRETALKLLADRGIEEGTNLIEIGKVPTESEKKIGINTIKTFLPHLYVRSSNSQRGFVIFEAQGLTTAAQSALLKILEEPPAHLVIVLTAPSPRLLLPTVVSRCLTTPVRQGRTGQAETQEGLIKEIVSAQSGQRLALFEEKIGYDQEDVLTFLDEVEAHLQKSLNSKPSVAHAPSFLTSFECAQLLIKLWRAKMLLRSESANIKLIIDELLLSW